MKIEFKFPPPGEKDGFSADLTRVEWTFKFFTWIVLIGTLRYAGSVTDKSAFTIWAAYLNLELGYLAYSFVQNRVKIEVVSDQGSRQLLRYTVNFVIAAIVAIIAWQMAGYIVRMGVDEVVKFNQSSHPSPTPSGTTKP